MSQSRGFTLIELLVVIAILAVLAAVLFPVFARATEKAREATCVSNVKQLLEACMMYATDYDRTLPPARCGRIQGSLGYTWCVLLQPYIDNEEILVCPSDTQPQLARRSTDLPHSYGINYDITFNARSWSSRPLTYRLTALSGLSTKVLFFDLSPDAEAMGASFSAHRLSRVAPRHFERAVFGFADGHAKAIRPQQTVADTNMWVP